MAIKSNNPKDSYYNQFSGGHGAAVGWFDPGSNDAGKTNAVHFYKLGTNSFDDQGTAGTRDLTMYNSSSAALVGTPFENTAGIAKMPPGLGYARLFTGSSGYEANWTTSNGGFDWSGTYAVVGIFLYPTDQIGNPNQSNYGNWFVQSYTGRDYAVDMWQRYDNSGRRARFDWPAADYNSRGLESTSWGTANQNQLTLNQWNYMRWGKDSGNFRYENYVYDGSSWERRINLSDGSISAGPDGSSSDESITLWAGNQTNRNRGQQGLVGNFSFYTTDVWDTDPPST